MKIKGITMKKTLLATLMMLVGIWGYGGDGKPFGVGIGSPYGGLGISYKLSESNYYSFASGGLNIAGYSEKDGFLRPRIVAGIGVLTSKYIKPETEKHSLGMFLGVFVPLDSDDGKAGVYIAPEYRYNFNGLGNRGWNIGLNLPISSSNLGVNIHLGFNF